MKGIFSKAFLKQSEEIESMTKLQKLAAMGMLGLGLSGTPAFAKQKAKAPQTPSVEQVVKGFDGTTISYDDFEKFLQAYGEENYGTTDEEDLEEIAGEARDALLDDYGITQEGSERAYDGGWRFYSD